MSHRRPFVFALRLIKGFLDLGRRGAHTRKYMYIKSLGRTATRLQTMLLSKHLQKKMDFDAKHQTISGYILSISPVKGTFSDIKKSLNFRSEKLSEFLSFWG